MKATDADLIEEALEKLDFDPTCQVRVNYAAQIAGVIVPLFSRTCTAPATWLAVCRKCNASAFTCDAHHEEARTAVLVSCGVCAAAGSVAAIFAETRFGA